MFLGTSAVVQGILEQIDLQEYILTDDIENNLTSDVTRMTATVE